MSARGARGAAPSGTDSAEAGTVAGDAARSGRRTARPHARPAASPSHHEVDRHEAEMTGEPDGDGDGDGYGYVTPDIRAQDLEYSGPLKQDIDNRNAVAWGDAIGASFIPRELKRAMKRNSVPDWTPPPNRTAPPGYQGDRPPVPAGPDGYESADLTRGQADIARFILVGLQSGELRALGRRATHVAPGQPETPELPHEWIPRTEWSRMKSMSGQPWRTLFVGANAFKLRPDERAWCEVWLVEVKPKNRHILRADAARSAVPLPAERVTKSPFKQEHALGIWLRAQLQADKVTSKDDWFERAHKQFPDCTKEAFSRAWQGIGAEAEFAWIMKAGRKPRGK